MKFYIPCDRLVAIEDYDCKWLTEANFIPSQRKIVLQEWASGWIFESDEEFNTYFTLITGHKLPTITNEEYNQFVMDKVAFLSKERANQFKLAWINFLPNKR